MTSTKSVKPEIYPNCLTPLRPYREMGSVQSSTSERARKMSDPFRDF
jgi:hypothetical protein